jgi:hypothetical protein
MSLFMNEHLAQGLLVHIVGMQENPRAEGER